MNHMYGGVYIPNLSNYGEKYGIGQYRFAHNFELVGKDLRLLAEGQEFALHFPNRVDAVWNGQAVEWEAEKFSTKLYFVRLGEDCVIICLAKGKCVICLHGRQKPLCGLIAGWEPTEPPAAAGDGMVGTKVRWVFGVNRYVNQDICGEHELRSAWSRNTVMAGNCKTFRDGWEPDDGDYRPEHVEAIHYGKSYYVVDITTNVPEGVCAPREMQRMVLLQDYDRMMTIGCAFGEGMKPIMLAGYARFLD